MAPELANGKHIKINATLKELMEKVSCPRKLGKLSSLSSTSATRLVLSSIPA
jgi:hypothetical protein